MRGITHGLIGANAAWIPAILGYSVSPLLALLGGFVALLPDLDASESSIKHLSLSGYVGGARVRLKPFYLIAFVTGKIFRHRGIFHSLVAITGLLIIGIFLPSIGAQIVLVAVCAYASHIAADALTKSGVELFWPLKKNFHLLPSVLRLKTGGIVDTLLLVCAGLGAAIFILTHLDLSRSFSFLFVNEVVSLFKG